MISWDPGMARSEIAIRMLDRHCHLVASALVRGAQQLPPSLLIRAAPATVDEEEDGEQ